MKIKQARIRSVLSYLSEFSEGESLRIVLEITQEHLPTLLKYGFDSNDSEIQTRIPRPIRRTSRINADGEWEVHRDQPKEPRVFEREYHCIDWHGGHHYGFCYQERMCYPRTRIPPELIAFTLHEGLLISPSVTCEEDNYDRIKLVMNLFLEMFGECETRTNDLTPKIPPTITRQIPWTILPAGQYPWEGGKVIIKPIIDSVPKRQQGVISLRHETIWNSQPQFIATGEEGFWGYIVYGFPERNLYVFESNRFDNATYVFRGNWESASRLTKAEILCGNLHDARIIHNDQWKRNIEKILRKQE